MKDLEKYDHRHGGPWDRGSADSYYRRGCHPHYFVGATHQSEMVEEKDMTQEEIEAYVIGYEENESMGNFKEWE